MLGFFAAAAESVVPGNNNSTGVLIRGTAQTSGTKLRMADYAGNFPMSAGGSVDVSGTLEVQ